MLQALVGIGGREAVETYIELIEHDQWLPVPEVWREDSIVSGALLDAFRERRAFRRRGASLIAALGGPASEECLVTALRDPYREVRSGS